MLEVILNRLIRIFGRQTLEKWIPLERLCVTSLTDPEIHLANVPLPDVLFENISVPFSLVKSNISRVVVKCPWTSFFKNFAKDSLRVEIEGVELVVRTKHINEFQDEFARSSFEKKKFKDLSRATKPSRNKIAKVVNALYVTAKDVKITFVDDLLHGDPFSVVIRADVVEVSGMDPQDPVLEPNQKRGILDSLLTAIIVKSRGVQMWHLVYKNGSVGRNGERSEPPNGAHDVQDEHSIETHYGHHNEHSGHHTIHSPYGRTIHTDPFRSPIHQHDHYGHTSRTASEEHEDRVSEYSHSSDEMFQSDNEDVSEFLNVKRSAFCFGCSGEEAADKEVTFTVKEENLRYLSILKLPYTIYKVTPSAGVVFTLMFKKWDVSALHLQKNAGEDVLRSMEIGICADSEKFGKKSQYGHLFDGRIKYKPFALTLTTAGLEVLYNFIKYIQLVSFYRSILLKDYNVMPNLADCQRYVHVLGKPQILHAMDADFIKKFEKATPLPILARLRRISKPVDKSGGLLQNICSICEGDVEYSGDSSWFIGERGLTITIPNAQLQLVPASVLYEFVENDESDGPNGSNGSVDKKRPHGSTGKRHLPCIIFHTEILRVLSESKISKRSITRVLLSKPMLRSALVSVVMERRTFSAKISFRHVVDDRLLVYPDAIFYGAKTGLDALMFHADLNDSSTDAPRELLKNWHGLNVESKYGTVETREDDVELTFEGFGNAVRTMYLRMPRMNLVINTLFYFYSTLGPSAFRNMDEGFLTLDILYARSSRIGVGNVEIMEKIGEAIKQPSRSIFRGTFGDITLKLYISTLTGVNKPVIDKDAETLYLANDAILEQWDYCNGIAEPFLMRGSGETTIISLDAVPYKVDTMVIRSSTDLESIISNSIQVKNADLVQVWYKNTRDLDLKLEGFNGGIRDLILVRASGFEIIKDGGMYVHIGIREVHATLSSSDDCMATPSMGTHSSMMDALPILGHYDEHTINETIELARMNGIKFAQECETYSVQVEDCSIAFMHQLVDALLKSGLLLMRMNVLNLVDRIKNFWSLGHDGMGGPLDTHHYGHQNWSGWKTTESETFLGTFHPRFKKSLGKGDAVQGVLERYILDADALKGSVLQAWPEVVDDKERLLVKIMTTRLKLEKYSACIREIHGEFVRDPRVIRIKVGGSTLKADPGTILVACTLGDLNGLAGMREDAPTGMGNHNGSVWKDHYNGHYATRNAKDLPGLVKDGQVSIEYSESEGHAKVELRNLHHSLDMEFWNECKRIASYFSRGKSSTKTINLRLFVHNSSLHYSGVGIKLELYATVSHPLHDPRELWIKVPRMHALACRDFEVLFSFSIIDLALKRMPKDASERIHFSISHCALWGVENASGLQNGHDGPYGEMDAHSGDHRGGPEGPVTSSKTREAVEMLLTLFQEDWYSQLIRAMIPSAALFSGDSPETAHDGRRNDHHNGQDHSDHGSRWSDDHHDEHSILTPIGDILLIPILVSKVPMGVRLAPLLNRRWIKEWLSNVSMEQELDVHVTNILKHFNQPLDTMYGDFLSANLKVYTVDGCKIITGDIKVSNASVLLHLEPILFFLDGTRNLWKTTSTGGKGGSTIINVSVGMNADVSLPVDIESKCRKTMPLELVPSSSSQSGTSKKRPADKLRILCKSTIPRMYSEVCLNFELSHQKVQGFYIPTRDAQNGLAGWRNGRMDAHNDHSTEHHYDHADPFRSPGHHSSRWSDDHHDEHSILTPISAGEPEDDLGTILEMAEEHRYIFLGYFESIKSVTSLTCGSFSTVLYSVPVGFTVRHFSGAPLLQIVPLMQPLGLDIPFTETVKHYNLCSIDTQNIFADACTTPTRDFYARLNLDSVHIIDAFGKFLIKNTSKIYGNSLGQFEVTATRREGALTIKCNIGNTRTEVQPEGLVPILELLKDIKWAVRPSMGSPLFSSNAILSSNAIPASSKEGNASHGVHFNLPLNEGGIHFNLPLHEGGIHFNLPLNEGDVRFNLEGPKKNVLIRLDRFELWIYPLTTTCTREDVERSQSYKFIQYKKQAKPYIEEETIPRILKTAHRIENTCMDTANHEALDILGCTSSITFTLEDAKRDIELKYLGVCLGRAKTLGDDLILVDEKGDAFYPAMNEWRPRGAHNDHHNEHHPDHHHAHWSDGARMLLETHAGFISIKEEQEKMNVSSQLNKIGVYLTVDHLFRFANLKPVLVDPYIALIKMVLDSKAGNVEHSADQNGRSETLFEDIRHLFSKHGVKLDTMYNVQYNDYVSVDQKSVRFTESILSLTRPINLLFWKRGDREVTISCTSQDSHFTLVSGTDDLVVSLNLHEGKLQLVHGAPSGMSHTILDSSLLFNISLISSSLEDVMMQNTLLTTKVARKGGLVDKPSLVTNICISGIVLEFNSRILQLIQYITSILAVDTGTCDPSINIELYNALGLEVCILGGMTQDVYDKMLTMPPGTVTSVPDRELFIFLKRSSIDTMDGVGQEWIMGEYKNLLFGNSNNVKNLLGLFNKNDGMDDHYDAQNGHSMLTHSGEGMEQLDKFLFLGKYENAPRLFNFPNTGYVILVEPSIDPFTSNINIIVSSSVWVQNSTSLNFILSQDAKVGYLKKLAYRIRKKNEPREEYKSLYINSYTSTSIPISWFGNGIMPMITPVFQNQFENDAASSAIQFQQLHLLLNKQHFSESELNGMNLFVLKFRGYLGFKCSLAYTEICHEDDHAIVYYKFVITIEPMIKIINNLPFNVVLYVSLFKNVAAHEEDSDDVYQLMTSYRAVKRLSSREAWGIPFSEQRIFIKLAIQGAPLRSMGNELDPLVTFVSSTFYLNLPSFGKTFVLKPLKFLAGQFEALEKPFLPIMDATTELFRNKDYFQYMKRIQATFEVSRNSVTITWPFSFENITNAFIMLNGYIIPPGFKLHGNLQDATNSRLRAFINIGESFFLHTNQSGKLDLTSTTTMRPPIYLNVPIDILKRCALFNSAIQTNFDIEPILENAKDKILYKRRMGASDHPAQGMILYDRIGTPNSGDSDTLQMHRPNAHSVNNLGCLGVSMECVDNPADDHYGVPAVAISPGSLDDHHDTLRSAINTTNLTLGCTVRYSSFPYNACKVVTISNLFTFVNKLPFSICIRGISADGSMECGDSNDLVITPGESCELNTPYTHAYVIKLENGNYSSKFPLIPPRVPSNFQLELNSENVAYTTMASRGILIQVNIISGRFSESKLPCTYNGYYFVLSIPNTSHYQVLNITKYTLAYTVPENLKTIEAKMVEEHSQVQFGTRVDYKIGILPQNCITHYVPSTCKIVQQHEIALKVLNAGSEWTIHPFSIHANGVSGMSFSIDGKNVEIYTATMLRHDGSRILVILESRDIAAEIRACKGAIMRNEIHTPWSCVTVNIKTPRITLTLKRKRRVIIATHFTNLAISLCQRMNEWPTQGRMNECMSEANVMDGQNDDLDAHSGHHNEHSIETHSGHHSEHHGSLQSPPLWLPLVATHSDPLWALSTIHLNIMVKAIHIDHFLHGFIPVILKSLAKRHSKQESFLECRFTGSIYSGDTPLIIDSANIKTSPLSVNIEMRVIEEIVDYLEMIKLQIRSDEIAREYSARPEPKWNETKATHPVYILDFCIEPINLILAIRTSDVKLSRQTLQLLDALPLDTPSVCVHFASEKRSHSLVCLGELVHSLKHSYLRQLIRQSLPTAWLSNSFAILHGIVKGLISLVTLPFTSSKNYSKGIAPSIEGFVFGIGSGIKFLILYIVGGIAQSMGHVLNVFQKILGRKRARPLGILDALWLGINGMLLDIFVRPWKKIVMDFKRAKGNKESKSKICAKLATNMIQCILCPVFAVMNMTITVAEGLSNILLGDFEQFTHIYESDQLEKPQVLGLNLGLPGLSSKREERKDTLIKRIKTATIGRMNVM